MKKFIQKFKPLDIAILAAILIIIVIGVLVYFGKNKIFSSSPVEFTKKIEFEVMVRGVTQTDPNIPFVTGQETFITIRNVPYTKLKITGVKYAPKQMVIPVKDGDKPYMIVEDFSQLYMYDYIIKLQDMAKITKDGAVVGGNKIKIGIPIVLEGFNYRVNGTISNVQIIEDVR